MGGGAWVSGVERGEGEEIERSTEEDGRGGRLALGGGGVGGGRGGRCGGALGMEGLLRRICALLRRADSERAGATLKRGSAPASPDSERRPARGNLPKLCAVVGWRVWVVCLSGWLQCVCVMAAMCVCDGCNVCV